MSERKPDWLEEALDQVADMSAVEWPDMDPANFEWTALKWEDDNGEA